MVRNLACFIAPLVAAALLRVVGLAARGSYERLGLRTLELLLWGGAVLLAAEHAWAGEIVPWPPFLTAMSSPTELSVALREIATAGSAMVAAATSLWASLRALSSILARGETRAVPKVTTTLERA
ncbi:MAG: hypothetical protein QXU97_03890 [Fervidicoccaceae archaeon]